MRLATTLLVAGAAALLAPIGTAKAGATLDDVKKKGFVQCGVNTGPRRASPTPTTPATGPGSTSTSAAPSPPPSSATPRRSSTRR